MDLFKDIKKSFALSALFKACRKGDIQRVTALLEKDVDVNGRDRRDFTPLMWAAHNGHTDIVRLLISKGASLDNECLLWAAVNNRLDTAKLLIENGANIERETTNKTTSLIFAARQGHVDMVNFLLDKGANIEAVNEDGRTALLEAAREGQKKTALLLIDKGADIDRCDKQGMDIVLLAIGEGHGRMAQALEELVTKIKLQSKEKDTETWRLIGTEKIAQVAVYPKLRRKLTNIFDFANRERLVITSGLDSRQESISQPVRFEDVPKEMLEKACAEFNRLSGAAPKGFTPPAPPPPAPENPPPTGP